MTRITAIPVTPGARYHVEASLQTLDAGKAYIAASYWTASSAYAGGTDSSPLHLSGTTGWTLVTLDTTAPPGAAYLRVETRLDGPGTTWADDISVLELS
jgi:hypothetical protein